AYPLAEALWVVEHGATDVVVAYPTADRSALSRLAMDEQAREAITVMVDETAQMDLILDAARARSGAPVLSPRRRIRVAIELDADYSPMHGVRMGALSSPQRSSPPVLDLARELHDRPGQSLVGLMAYEGQIAGVTDAARTPYGAAVRVMKALSAREIAERRAATVAAVRQIADLAFVNGGGTGSIETT